MIRLNGFSVRGAARTGVAVAALLTGLGATTAFAQAENPADTNDGGLADIVVTAQRYDQRLQETPISVVAMDAGQLASMGVDSLQGFDAFIPNVSVGGTGGQGNAVANFSIRGIGGAGSGFVTQESAVGVYVDDILFARPNGALLDLLDIERLEVLRGPQGTLFGRNTAGGAIRYITRKPTDRFEGSFKGVLGSRNRRDISGTVNLPLADELAARVSFSNKKQDGYITRLVDGVKTGNNDSTAVRGQLEWKPTSRLTINISGDSIHTTDHGSPTIISNYSVTDIYPNALYGIQGPGQPPVNAAAYTSMRNLNPGASASGWTNAASDFAGYTTTNPYGVYGGDPDLNTYRSLGLAGTIAYELTDSIVFKSLTGYRDAHQSMKQDWDRTPIWLNALWEKIDIEYYTQEFQLNGNSFDGRLKWVVGAFYYHDQADDYRRRFDPSGGAVGSDGQPGQIENKYITTESLAAFGQGTLNFTDRFSTTLGLRWNRDKKHYTTLRDGRNLVGGMPAPYSVDGSWSNVSPRISLEQRWTPDVMTYQSAAMGFKGGGFNDTIQRNCSAPGIVNCGLTEYRPEKLWTYEAGIRSEFLDRKVRLNITGFYTKYNAMQVQLIDNTPPPFAYTTNADATVKGVEVDALAAVTPEFLLRGSFGYTKSKYDQGILAQTGGTIGVNTPFLRSPEISYSLGATYTYALKGDAEVKFDVDWGWKDKQASTSTPTNMVMLPSYGLLNGRLEYRSGKNWSLAVYGTNLLDKYYYTGGFDPSGPSSKPAFGTTKPHDALFGFTMLDVGRPREVGVELNVRF